MIHRQPDPPIPPRPTSGANAGPWSPRASRAAICLLLTLAAFLFYRQLPLPATAAARAGDNLWYVPSAVSLLRHGDLELGEHTALRPRNGAGLPRLGYQLTALPDGRVYNYFPVGVAIASLPVVALAMVAEDAFADAPELDAARFARWSDLTADAWAAVAVGLVFLLACGLGAAATADPAASSPGSEPAADLRIPLLLAAIFALATPHLPTHAGGLWNHNPGQTLLLAGLLALLGSSLGSAALAGGCLALAYTCRPTGAVIGLVAAAYLALHARRRLVAAAGGWSLVIGPFVAWSLATFGSVLPAYFTQRRFHPPGFLEALAGLLVSPNRGLLTFAPVLLLVPVSLWLAGRQALRRRRRERGTPHGAADPAQPRLHPLFAVITLGVLADLVIAALYRKWWGGGAFGPRLLTGSLGLAVLLLLPLARWLTVGSIRDPWRRLGLAAAAITLALGLAINLRGAIAPAVYVWNATPQPVDNRPERCWDWHDLQFLR